MIYNIINNILKTLTTPCTADSVKSRHAARNIKGIAWRRFLPRKKEVWQAPARALEPMPPVSWNTVNGVGETVRRPPSPFFWHELKYHEFVAMQGYTLGVMYGLDDADEIRGIVGRDAASLGGQNDY